MKKLFLLGSLLLATLVLFAGNGPDDIVGVWKNGSGKGHVQIFKQSGKYFGKIIWLRDGTDEKGQPKKDRKNPDPAQRNRPLIGLVMLKGFTYDDREWTNGRVYNPSDGKEYKAYIKMKDSNTLSVRGYVGFSLFGKTDTWTRVR